MVRTVAYTKCAGFREESRQGTTGGFFERYEFLSGYIETLQNSQIAQKAVV